MRRVYFSSTSYNCTEAVAISHTLRNDNKVEEKNGWRPWRVNVCETCATGANLCPCFLPLGFLNSVVLGRE